jgi:hypothetical protein
MNHSIGKSGFHMSSIASMWNSDSNSNDPEIRVELTLDGKNSKQQYAILEKGRLEIEGAIGFPLKWHNPEDKNSCRIFTRINADFLDNHLWPQQHEWLRKNLETFHKVFAPIIKALD